MHEIQYALIGQQIACEMVTRALTARFANPKGATSPLVMLLLGPPGHGAVLSAPPVTRVLFISFSFLSPSLSLARIKSRACFF
jgi:hypothetical protein